jgi:hypothetical protein
LQKGWTYFPWKVSLLVEHGLPRGRGNKLHQKIDMKKSTASYLPNDAKNVGFWVDELSTLGPPE